MNITSKFLFPKLRSRNSSRYLTALGVTVLAAKSHHLLAEIKECFFEKTAKGMNPYENKYREEEGLNHSRF